MKKMLIAAVIVVVLLSVLPMSASARPPMPVDGVWEYLPYIKVKNDAGECVKPVEDDTRPPCVKIAGGNQFLQTYEDGWWTGDFDGTSVEHGRVTIHRSGRSGFKAIVYFEGEVKGKAGTMQMSVVGVKADATTDWQGQWVILRGTGELASLHGQGTWWGPGWQGDPDVPGIIDYEGQVHFAP